VSKRHALERLAASLCDYSHVEVKLTGSDGNGFAILSKVINALHRAGASKAELEAFQAEATSGDYDHLLSTAMDWVTVT